MWPAERLREVRHYYAYGRSTKKGRQKPLRPRPPSSPRRSEELPLIPPPAEVHPLEGHTPERGRRRNRTPRRARREPGNAPPRRPSGTARADESDPLASSNGPWTVARREPTRVPRPSGSQTPRPRVAIAHDYLTQRGAPNAWFLALHRAFRTPRSQSNLYDPDGTYPEFREARSRCPR
jgi:hypothetical protein